MNERFNGKVAIITGAARGIGKATSRILASEGCTVVIADINKEEAEKTKSEFNTLGYRAESFQCDISKVEDVEKLIASVHKQFERIDILVNNAGILISATIEETTNDIIDRTININLKGVLYAIRAVTPIMKKQKYGRIVNIGSITGKNGDNTSTFVYGASKGAVISLTRSVARQLGPYGITCNAVAPHAIMTELMSYWSEEKKLNMAKTIPVRRLGTEEDVASLICYLASNEASFINGETVNINGGYYMD
ncbi:MAG: 3-oxoacyl-(acyl-carrier-protein) reductase FabG [Spirochaetes bacterium ADurb.Bin110]|jgi:3-oxoacyl-[acyl-carrier protein] reductase|nr:MAG: 3-oxoacyl-(acyl-carrier-protein) reductase FabG [Spirochaetes bacterium ADurb.Bin110]HNV37214.1 glucose 1-dehydrogenase [Rectinema sp.]HQJ23525.1 glucose 1-dehydrogenase [Rectinema sp.]